MKKATRLSSIILAIMMATTAFAGCSQQSQQSNSTADSTPASSGETASTEEASSSEPQEIVNIRWIVPGDPLDGAPEVMAAINEKIKDQGLSLDLQMEPFGSYNDKVGLMISSQEEFDLCFTTAGWLNLYIPNITRGAFVEIGEMVDTYAPELKEAIPETLFETLKVNGGLYAVPNYQISYDCRGIQVKTEILEKYNFDLSSVKTYQDLEPLLEQLVVGEPGYYPVKWEVDSLDYNMEYIAVDDMGTSFYIDDPERKLDPGIERERELAALSHDWWEKGYVRSNTMVTDDTADTKAGKYLTYVGCVIKPGGEAERSAQTDGSEYTQVALTKPFITSANVRGAMTAVSASSKHPEAAVKMLGIANTDKEVFNMMVFGLEGRDYTFNEDNKLVKTENAPYHYGYGWAIGNQFNAFLMEGQQDGIWEETDKINREAAVSPVSGFTFDPANVTSEMAKMASVNEEYKDLAFYDDWEERFDEYQEKLDLAGRDTYIAEVQSQLDAWIAENQ